MYRSNEKDYRVKPFMRNDELERLLTFLNELLLPAEKQMLQRTSDFGSSYPIIFIMGPLRSGTTLFMQWLANSGVVAYPTNLLSRFYGAPAIGAQIQLLLTDPRYQFRNEIREFNNPISFQSENGKTAGALEPNEIWYFWRRFLPFKEIDWMPDEELARVVDGQMLSQELTTLSRIFQKPFALKAMILNYNIPFLNAIFEKALFVQLKRNHVCNIASVLGARERQFGTREQWYSFKIPEYPELKDMDAVTQAAGQVVHIDKAVTQGIGTIAQSRSLVVKYEEFCDDPRHIFMELLKKLGMDESTVSYVGPRQFDVSHHVKTSERRAIEEALSIFSP